MLTRPRIRMKSYLKKIQFKEKNELESREKRLHWPSFETLEGWIRFYLYDFGCCFANISTYVYSVQARLLLSIRTLLSTFLYICFHRLIGLGLIYLKMFVSCSLEDTVLFNKMHICVYTCNNGYIHCVCNVSVMWHTINGSYTCLCSWQKAVNTVYDDIVKRSEAIHWMLRNLLCRFIEKIDCIHCTLCANFTTMFPLCDPSAKNIFSAILMKGLETNSLLYTAVYCVHNPEINRFTESVLIPMLRAKCTRSWAYVQSKSNMFCAW